jgi:protein NrfD
MNTEIIHIIQSGPYWDWRVALDLFLGGAGVGALLFAVFIDEWFHGKYERICRTAAWLAPILIGAGLLLVLLKMGRPLMLFLAYVNFNPTSPLWWGGIFQPLLIMGGIWYAIKWQRSKSETTSRRRLGRLLVALGLVVGTYHGLLLSVMPSRPLWNTGPTVVAALLGFASTGIAVVMLVHLIRMYYAGRLNDFDHVAHFLDNMRVVRNILVAVLLVQLGTFFLWWLSLDMGALQDRLALAAANEAYGPQFWLLGIGGGIIAPLILGAYAVWRRQEANHKWRIRLIGLASALILVGGFFLRLHLVLGGQIQLTTNSVF